MAEKKTTPVVINDVEYKYEDMTEKQQVIVNHCADLDRKIRSTQFNLDQLSVGKEAFVKMLTEDLEVVAEAEPTVSTVTNPLIVTDVLEREAARNVAAITPQAVKDA